MKRCFVQPDSPSYSRLPFSVRISTISRSFHAISLKIFTKWKGHSRMCAYTMLLTSRLIWSLIFAGIGPRRILRCRIRSSVVVGGMQVSFANMNSCMDLIDNHYRSKYMGFWGRLKFARKPISIIGECLPYFYWALGRPLGRKWLTNDCTFCCTTRCKTRESKEKRQSNLQWSSFSLTLFSSLFWFPLHSSLHS